MAGTSHQSTGLPCQDSHDFRLIESDDGGILVAVVSDGAGSAAYADVAARMASQLLIATVEEYVTTGGKISGLERPLVAAWLSDLVIALTNHASDLGHALRDYSCTLLMVAASKDATAFFQIGDGAIVVSHGTADGWSYVFWPQHGEYANTTNFVVTSGSLELFEFEVAPRPVSEFAIFSDGLEKLVLHDATKSVHQAFFEQMFPPVRELEGAGMDTGLSESLGEYLASSAVCERTDDDKTLILASRSSTPLHFARG